MWDSHKKGYKAHLQLEKSLSDNSVEAYLYDIEKFTDWMQKTNGLKTPKEIVLKDIEDFTRWISQEGNTKSSGKMAYRVLLKRV